MPRRRLLLLLFLGVVLHLVVAGWFAWQRPIDGDEGYYGLAARLVAAGQTPYADFFYPQAPLLPYLYAPAATLAGAPQLPGLRLMSVALSGLALALAAGWLGRAHAERPATALVVLLLLALSPELLTWNTTVKTFAAANLGALAGLLALDRAVAGNRRHGWLLAGGFALGLTVATRLLYAPVALVPAAWLAWRRRDLSGALTWLGGLTAGLIPVWIAFFADPARFWFNNVGYHQLRFSPLETAPLLVRVQAAGEVLAVSLLGNPGLLIAVLLAILGLVTWRRSAPDRRSPLEPVSLAAAGTLLVAGLLPDPVHMQYFTGGLTVLLLPAAAGGLARLPAVRRGRWHLALALAAPLLCWLGLGVIRHDLSSRPEWRLDHYHRVSRRLAEITTPDQVVFCYWSGYAAGAGRQPYSGTENHFAVGVSERLSFADRRRFKVIGRQEMATAFRYEVPAAAVIGAWMYDVDTALDDDQMLDLLAEFNRHYRLIAEFDGVGICRRLRDLPAADAP
jgi:4-amino-4-deoxy-L-arabinose transferase-like glycosyltransferase